MLYKNRPISGRNDSFIRYFHNRREVLILPGWIFIQLNLVYIWIRKIIWKLKNKFIWNVNNHFIIFLEYLYFWICGDEFYLVIHIILRLEQKQNFFCHLIYSHIKSEEIARHSQVYGGDLVHSEQKIKLQALYLQKQKN